MRHRFGVAGVLGHTVLTAGLALILQPTLQALGIAAVFGALVGALKPLAGNAQTIGVLLPVAAASAVSGPAFWILFPGAVSLIGMAEFVGSDRQARLDVFIAISVGMLVGTPWC